jgi:hypothetical protein
MASTKRSSGGTRKSTASRSRATSASKAASGTRTPKTRSNGRATTAQGAKTTPKTTARTTSGAASRNGAKRSQNGRAQSGGSTRTSRAASQPNGAVGTLKQKSSAVLQAADKAGGPALTVAAAVAGLAGGLALRQRNHRIVESSLTGRSRNILRDIDPSAVIEGLGKASAQLGKQSKTIARELDQVADRAERLGKILS